VDTIYSRAIAISEKKIELPSAARKEEKGKRVKGYRVKNLR
jgi:hypothetical protein